MKNDDTIIRKKYFEDELKQMRETRLTVQNSIKKSVIQATLINTRFFCNQSKQIGLRNL